MSTTQDLNFLKAAPARMSFLAAHYKQVLAKIHAERPYVNGAEYLRQLEQAKAEQARQVSMLRDQCESARARIQAQANLSRGEAGRHSDPARAMLEAQAWARIRPVLERQPSFVEMVGRAQQMIAEAGKRGDLSTLRAFTTELPSYLEAHEHPQDRARRIAAGKPFEESNGALQRLLADVATVGAPHLPVEELRAYALEQALAPYGQAIEGNLARLEMVTNDSTGMIAQGGMIGWEPGTYIRPGSQFEEEARPNGTSAELAE